uniref:Uncharacterized protein n=1 Tax=Amphilophus citrinellus TaxID=61819 RepID=A0A3Q0QXH4_AMPCI
APGPGPGSPRLRRGSAPPEPARAPLAAPAGSRKCIHLHTCLHSDGGSRVFTHPSPTRSFCLFYFWSFKIPNAHCWKLRTYASAKYLLVDKEI